MRKEGREDFVVISKKKEEEKNPKTLITDREPSALS